MNKERYQWYMGTSEIIDNKTKKFITQDCPELLNKQSKQISDLETKLADLQQEQIKEMQEHQEAMELADKTITNLVEDNRASQEWYKKQLAESESRFQAHKQNDARIIQDQTDLIENLKQQLAESEEFLVATKWNVQDLNKQLADTEEQNKRVLEKLELIVSANQELEQKLAESENSLKCTTDHYEKYCAELNSQNVMLHASAFNHNQYKISFAVEQLSTLRNFVNSKAIFSKNECECECEVCRDIAQTIDNRIKRLEEGEWT